jgi:hypothetical protein
VSTKIVQIKALCLKLALPQGAYKPVSDFRAIMALLFCFINLYSKYSLQVFEYSIALKTNLITYPYCFCNSLKSTAWPCMYFNVTSFVWYKDKLNVRLYNMLYNFIQCSINSVIWSITWLNPRLALLYSMSKINSVLNLHSFNFLYLVLGISCKDWLNSVFM